MSSALFHASMTKLNMLSERVGYACFCRRWHEPRQRRHECGAAVNKRGDSDESNKNGVNMSTALSIVEMCYGDTGLLLSMPRQGLGNSAIAAVANDEQLQRFRYMGSDGDY